MGCVHTHRRILVIEGWGNSSWVQSAMEKIGEDNKKVGNINRTVS